ncbi:MAG: hypothetical protein ACTH6H_15700, partial [Serratia sp. (in: enterobacteria)]
SFAARLFNLLLFIAFIDARLCDDPGMPLWHPCYALYWCTGLFPSSVSFGVFIDGNIIFSYFSVD